MFTYNVIEMRCSVVFPMIFFFAVLMEKNITDKKFSMHRMFCKDQSAKIHYVRIQFRLRTREFAHKWRIILRVFITKARRSYNSLSATSVVISFWWNLFQESCYPLRDCLTVEFVVHFVCDADFQDMKFFVSFFFSYSSFRVQAID